MSQAVMSCPTWLLGAEHGAVGSLQEQQSLLTTQLSPSSPKMQHFKLSVVIVHFPQMLTASLWDLKRQALWCFCTYSDAEAVFPMCERCCHLKYLNSRHVIFPTTAFL